MAHRQGEEPMTVTTTQSKWFSSNPDKAFGEKLFLSYFIFFMSYQTLLQKMGWVDVNDFWGTVTTLITWIPYLVILPAFLRRNSGVAWRDSYWFKLNVYMVVYVFFATYFHSEWFFKSLGMRYNFPQQFWTFDSMLCGPDQATARENFQVIPLSRYLDTMGFFTVYHTIAVVAMRRVKNMTMGLSAIGQRAAWVAIVVVASFFFAWAETFFYIRNAVSNTVWYMDKSAMLAVGSGLYGLLFLVSFPNVFRLDETVGQKWTITRTIVEASFVSMVTLFLIDMWVRLHGPIV
jgi:cycloeucalenol cycloisomerase